MSEDPSSSILRGVRTLVGLAELGKPVSLAVLAETLQLPPSSTHRIVTLLKKAGYVTQDPETGSYQPGPSFLRAATSFCSAGHFPRAASQALDGLVEEFSETAFYGGYMVESQRFRFISVKYSDHAIQYVAKFDKLYSPLWGASGRALAAYLPEPTLRAIYNRDRATSEGNAPLPPWEQLLVELAEVRAQGYCTTIGQRFEGAHSTAAAVFGRDSQVIGSIGITMPALRRDETRIPIFARRLAEVARDLSYVAQCAVDQTELKRM